MSIKKMTISMLFVCLAGCSQPPSVGDKMLEHSQRSKAMGEQWKKGENLVKKGKALEEDGASLITRGNKQINKGKKLISNGEKQVQKGNAKLHDSKSKINEGVSLQDESQAQFAEKYPGKLQ